MSDQDAEIEQLQNENNRLRAMLSRAGINLLPNVDLPSEEEASRLLRMVEANYPVLKGGSLTEFKNAIHFLCFVYRVEKPNREYATTYWTDLAREWLRSQIIHPASMGTKAFTAACVASGITFEPLDQFPYGVNLGISLGSASRPSAAWRQVLRNGIPRPVEMSR